jgi:hypothetical protein
VNELKLIKVIESTCYHKALGNIGPRAVVRSYIKVNVIRLLRDKNMIGKMFGLITLHPRHDEKRVEVSVRDLKTSGHISHGQASE